MSKSITLLVGTMTGTADLVAQEAGEVLRGAGYESRTLMMDALDADVFAGGGVFLVISSTYGNGDVPDNAQSFFASLQAERPDLSDVVYGVIALGDTTYKATFCQGGLKFDRLLAELGARRAGDPLTHDASSGTFAEDVGAQWVGEWLREELSDAKAA